MRVLPAVWLLGCGARATALAREDAAPVDAGAQADAAGGCDSGSVRCVGTGVDQCGDDGTWRVAAPSSVGCEFWAVDLDVSDMPGGDAASLPVIVRVSNPGPAQARVRVDFVDALGDEPIVTEEATVPGGDLRVLELPNRPVDSERKGGAAYRIVSDVPIFAFLESAPGVGEATALFPAHALGTRYVVASWPQTIAATEDPSTDFGEHRRTFLTIVGTADAEVTITATTAAITMPGAKGDRFRVGVPTAVSLGPYLAVNLESDGFLQDFTGTTIESTAPVAVFVGSEASDAPTWESLSERLCCAHHLVEQLPPRDWFGTSYVGVVPPNRPDALLPVVGGIADVPEIGVFRVVGVDPEGARITTTLPSPHDAFSLSERASVDFEATEDFILQSDAPVALLSLVSSSQTTGLPASLPSGGPAMTFVPPQDRGVREARVVLPDAFLFDFLSIVAPGGANVTLGGLSTVGICSEASIGEDGARILRCQLSFPEGAMEGGTMRVEPGRQEDTLQVVAADAPILVLAHGFDDFASYAMWGGFAGR